MPAADRTAFAESTTLAEATRGQQPSGRRMRIKLIDAGWGSSGYYSPAVLAEAAKTGVFPAGTHMYLNHPSMSEAVERPERSVKDLAAVLTSPADFTDGGLYAEARVFGPFQQLLAEQADAIGVSIRAAGTAEPGEAEGRQGLLVTSLTEGLSVDFVTRAGRGGAIVQLLESARAELREGRNIGQWLESRLHCMFTQISDEMYGEGRLTREERLALSSGIGDALTTFTGAIEKNAPQLYTRDLWDEPGETAANVSEAAPTLPVGAPSPGSNPLKEGITMSGSTQSGAPNGGATDTKPTDIAEAEARVKAAETKLAEAREQLERRSDHAVRLQEAERENTQLRQENHRFRALETARSTVAAALAESGLPETAWPRVTAAVVGHEGAGIPLTEAGAIDDGKLKTAIESAITDMKSFVAGIAEAAGVGSVRGLGASTGKDGELSEAAFEKEMEGVFSNIGMPSEQATLAAKGR